MKPFIVYAMIDDENRITAVDSSEFLFNTDGWTEIDNGRGDRYHHAQGNYFDKPIKDDRGIYRYKMVDGQPVERTAEEMDADYTPSIDEPTPEERIAALEEALDLLLSGVTE